MDELIQFYVFVDDDYKSEGNVIRTSLVDKPATRKLFAIFSEETKSVKSAFKVVEPTAENKQIVKSENGDFSRIVSGVWFMPDVDYYRELDGFEFTTNITREDLKQAVVNFVKAGNQNEFDKNHDEKKLDGLKTVEIWVLDDYEQKSPIFNYSIQDLGYKKEDIPLGSVFMSVFVENEQFFNKQIKSGKLKGFSIEAFFNISQKFSIQTMNKQKEMFAALGLNQETGDVITPNGNMKFSADKIELDGKVLKTGSVKLKSGFSIEVRDGQLVDFGFEETPPATTDDAPPATAEEDTPPETTPTTEAAATTETVATADVQKMIDDALKQADETRKAAADKAKADQEKSDADAAKQKEIDDLKAENERLKKGERIEIETVKAGEDFDKDKFRTVKVGNSTIKVLK